MTEQADPDPDFVAHPTPDSARSDTADPAAAAVEAEQPNRLAWLAERIASEDPFWVRAAACRQQAELPYQLRLLEVTGGICPEDWQARRWTYPNAVFEAQAVTGSELLAWFRNKHVPVGEIAVPFEVPAQPLQVERRGSHQQGQYAALPWPADEITLAFLPNVEPHGPFISPEDAPSFITMTTAAVSFFGMSAQIAGGHSLPSAAVVRWQDRRARINRVHFASDELTVDIEGDSLRNLTVELAGDSPGTKQRLWPNQGEEQWTATFALPDGLPAGAWILVRDAENWLDRRHLAWPWARGTEPGVEMEIEPGTKIEAYVANRENVTVEFKRELPPSDEGKARAMKTVCAYANGEGGVMLFGITDDYEVVGVPASKVGGLIDQLSQMIDSWLEPTPAYSFDTLLLEDEHFVVLELTVYAGQALYGSGKPNDSKRVYVRHHSTSVPARVSEIEALCRKRTATAASPYRR